MEARYADQGRRMTVVGRTILVGLCFFLAVLIARLVEIDTSLSQTLHARVVSQRTGQTVVPARRGCILDAAGRMVAGTRQRPSVFADPSMIEDVVAVARRLADALHLPAGLIEQTLRENSSRRFCWLARKIDTSVADAVKVLNISGVGVRDESQRYYPMGALLGPILGIVGVDGVGLEGLELVHDRHLRGRDGRHAAIYNGLKHNRRPIWRQSGGCELPADGGHIVLTLDSVIQEIAARYLRRAVDEFGAAGGVALVMEPATGALLAVSQVPTFDPGNYQEASREARRNRAVCDMFEPGSTFKPYIASGALLAGVIDPQEEIFCHNGLHYFGRRRMRDTTPHGYLTFAGIVAKSSNIGMGIIGERMGNEAMHRIVRAFGFGTPTGVRFPGEAAGLVRRLTKWTTYSTTSVPIGQEIAVTPIQLITAFSAIVNGGTLHRPRLVRALLDANGQTVESFDRPEVVRRALPTEIAQYMTREILVAVVKEGGGRPAALADWQMAGKTGTAQVAYVEGGGYEPDAYNSSFIAAAPAGDPRCVVLMVIHRPDAEIGYYGTTVAAPAVGRIMAETLAYLEVPPDTPVQREGL